MSVDSVQPTLISQAVHAGQDAHDERHSDSRHEGPSKRPGKNQCDSDDPHPVLNDLGHLTGRTINITA